MRFNTGFGPSCAEIINIFDEKRFQKFYGIMERRKSQDVLPEQLWNEDL